MCSATRSTDLRCIAYVSRMTVALSEQELLELAREARTVNAELDVTGILFCMGDRFIQVLEGPSEVVGRLYDVITFDPRHKDVVTTIDRPLDERAFARWSMRLVEEDDLSPSETAVVVRALRSVEPAASAPNPFRSLRELLTGPAAASMAGAFQSPPHNREDLDAAERLLNEAEAVINETGDTVALSLERLAADAGVSRTAVGRLFADISDLLRVEVRKTLLNADLAFLDLMVSQTFENRSDIALAIVAFILLMNGDHDDLPPDLDEQLRQQSLEVLCDVARPIAEAICAATPREGWPCPELGPTQIALALAATGAAARTLAKSDPTALGKADNQGRLLEICLAAVGAGA